MADLYLIDNDTIRSNRTFMELKSQQMLNTREQLASSNRTFMELK